MRVAVVVFPGSNADWDALHVSRDVMGFETEYVFHKQTSLAGFDAVIVPGGFAHGDYLRSGAIARFSPIAESLMAFAKSGGPVIGICNGFQILTEMGLLPGALTRNVGLRFECRDIWVRCETRGAFTQTLERGQVLRLPIAHADGRYHADDETYRMLEGEGLIAFRYCGPDGLPPPETVNGSRGEVAGIYNAKRNVLGLMPHPERASEGILGNTDGRLIFESLKLQLERAA